MSWRLKSEVQIRIVQLGVIQKACPGSLLVLFAERDMPWNGLKRTMKGFVKKDLNRGFPSKN